MLLEIHRTPSQEVNGIMLLNPCLPIHPRLSPPLQHTTAAMFMAAKEQSRDNPTTTPERIALAGHVKILVAITTIHNRQETCPTQSLAFLKCPSCLPAGLLSGIIRESKLAKQ
jgi:hypothetical protein